MRGWEISAGGLRWRALEVYELLPHFIRHVALREHNPWISVAVTASVLIGGFLLRYVVVYAGQVPQLITPA